MTTPKSYDEPAEVLAAALERRANAFGLALTPSDHLVRDDPGALTSLIEAIPVPRPEQPLPASKLPPDRRAYVIPSTGVSLLICALQDEFHSSYRAALWWVGLVRSDCSPTRRSDLHLFLVGPRGVRKQAEWIRRRNAVESDERFCRKFLWLPDDSPSMGELEPFLDRTLLGRPWDAASAQPSALDPFHDVVRSLPPNQTLDSQEAERWLARLAEDEDGGTQKLAQDLVALLSE